MLTKGAIGNLVNKYRAVLKKCGLLNVFGSLAVAGALVLGGAGLAVAAASWGPDKDVVITGTETLNNGEQSKNLTISGAANSLTVSSSTGHLYVSGATTLNDGGTLTLNTGPHGLLGTTDSAGEAADTWTGSFGMTGGTLAITDSQMQMDAVAISGGAATISGRIGGGTNWDDGAMLVGGLNGAATTVSGGKVTVDDYGQLVGGQVNISGGEVALNGDSGKDAILRSYGADNALTLSGDGKISVTASKYGVLTANAVNISGGTLDVAGNLTMAGALDKRQSLSDALKASGDATVNQTGGTVNVETGGALNIANGLKYKLKTGGTLSNAGTVTLQEGSRLYLEDGTLTGVTGTSKFVVENKIDDNVFTHLIFSSANFAEAQKGQIQNDGFIQVKGVGSINASKIVQTASAAGEIGFGSPSNLYVEQLTLTGADTLGASLDPSKPGTLTSDTLNIETTGGTSTVTNLSLVLTGANSTLNVTGGSGDGTLLLNNASAALLIGADPQLYGGTQTATINAAVTLDNQGMLSVGSAQTGSVATATFTKDVTLTNGSLVVAEGSTMNLDSGATLDVQAGSANLSGTLNVDGTLKSSAAGDGSTTGINVLQNGVLAAASTTLMKDSTTRADNLNSIWLDNGGTLRVTGLNTISTADMQTYKTALVAGGTGLINYGSATVTVSDADKGSTENSIKGAAAEGTGALLDGKTVEYAATSGAVTSNGNFGADTLAITGGDAAGNTVTANGDLTLLGDGTNLITADTGEVTKVAVAANKNLNLGSAGAVSKGGTLDSKVSLGNGSALNAAAAEYTVGDITAVADGNGTVTASAGATLTAGDIGDSTKNVGTVNATGGTVNAASIHTNTVTADGGQINAKTLTASGAVTVTDGVLIATGTGSDASSVGSLALTNAQASVGDLSVGGAATVDSSSFQAGNLDITGQTMQVLNSTASIKELTATGGTFFVDPAYVNIDGLAADTVDFALLVSDGSVVNIGGTGGADLRTALAQAGMSVGPDLTLATGQSGLALTSPVTVSGAGKIVVDAGVDASGQIGGATVNHQAYFGADSVLVVDASKLGADAAITSGTPTGSVTKTAVIDPDGHLQVVNATKGEVTLLDGFTGGISSDGATGTDYGWVKNGVANPDRMLTSTAAVDPAGSVTLTNTVNKASDVLPGLDGELNPAMADVWDNAKNDVNAEAKGVRFLSRAARADYIADARQAAVTIESAARMAVAGAVPQMTMAASNAAGNAVTQRTGLAQPGGNAIQSMGTDGSMQTGASAGDAAKTGFAMWVMPLYQSSNGFGMKAGNFDMDFSGGLGGVALGADYTFDNAIRAGITFNIGGGYAQGSGDLNETTNNMNFWGIGAYAGWTPGNFGLTADVNYTSTYNKLEQDLPASMQMGKLKSDVTAYAISAGLRGEYKIETSALDIIPHVGVRYMSLNTDEYDVKSGGTLLKGDAINQSIWTFPVGVAFSKQIETGNGWHFKPSLDLAVIPAAGDIDARSDVRFTGTGTKAELDTQTMDYVSYMGQAGLEFGNETTSLGVNYNIQLGAKSTAHGVFGTFRYEF